MTTQDAVTTRASNADEATESFLAGWRFPSLMLAVLASWPLLLLAVLLVPTGGDGEMAAFAEQFKTWCFGYDPATGEMQMAYVGMLVVNPLLLSAVVLGVWVRPLKWGWTHRRAAMGRWAALGVGTVLMLGAGLTLLTESNTAPFEGELPFPAEELRTNHVPPAFDLIDQDGKRVTTADMEGHVTLLTSVYASCPHTCPIILTESKQAMAALPEELRNRVQVFAITMDPENDGQEAMAALGEMHGMNAPAYRLLSGDAAQVEPLLDKLGVAREKDEETGVISHANLFILVDTNGKIAYRLALGPQQDRWLPTALEVLAREDRGAKPTI